MADYWTIQVQNKAEQAIHGWQLLRLGFIFHLKDYKHLLAIRLK